MWTDITDIVMGMALYVGPFVALPFILRREPAARRIAILALLVAPLIGAATYLIKNRKFSFEGLIFTYPFAMFPLGFWAALIGGLTTPLMIRLRNKYGQVTLLVAAGISGALIGPGFMFGIVHLAAWIPPSTHPVDLAFFLLCGLTVGITVGLLAAWIVGRMPTHAAVDS